MNDQERTPTTFQCLVNSHRRKERARDSRIIDLLADPEVLAVLNDAGVRAGEDIRLLEACLGALSVQAGAPEGGGFYQGVSTHSVLHLLNHRRFASRYVRYLDSARRRIDEAAGPSILSPDPFDVPLEPYRAKEVKDETTADDIEKLSE